MVRRRLRFATVVVLWCAEAVLVVLGGLAVVLATDNQNRWPVMLSRLPGRPLTSGLICLIVAFALASVWMVTTRRGRTGMRPFIYVGAAEVGVVGIGAIATNAATGPTPDWPPWLDWVPVGPVPVVIATILLGMGFALVRAQQDSTPPMPRIRRVWAMERPADLDIDRPVLTAQVRQQLADADGGTVGLTTALVGAGGFGKTTLGRLVCADPRVRRMFRAGVWVTVGQQVGKVELSGKINDVVEQLTGIRPGLTDPDLAGQRLGEILDRRPRVLLVVDDVWQPGQLRPFLHAGRHLTRLVTTRRPDVLPGRLRTRGVRVDELEPAEAYRVLTADLPAIVEPALDRLLTLTGRWPLLIRLTNAHLADVIAAGVEPDIAAIHLADRLEREGPDALDLADEGSRDRAVAANINASLDLLAPTRTDLVDGRLLYGQLAVFAEDSAIDRTLLLALWGATAGLRPGQVDHLCDRLAGLSLVADYQPGRSLRLHDVIRAYLRARARQTLQTLHATLVDAVRTLLPGNDPDAWWLLPDDAGYLWQHLCEHLAEAGRREQLTALLTDLRWAEARIRQDGLAALDVDLGRDPDPTVVLLRRSLVQVAHELTGDRPVAAALVALLIGVPGLEGVVEAYRAALSVAVPARPTPGPPRARALRRVLVGHTDTVWSGAIAPDGSWLVTTGLDATARIWDTATGTCRHVLLGHTTMVFDCVIAPDGSWLVTIGADNTPRVWDPATGALQRVLMGHAGTCTSCAVAPDGTWLVTTNTDKDGWLWNVPRWTQRERFASKAVCTRARWRRTGPGWRQ